MNTLRTVMGVGLTFLSACATVRPEFQQHFRPGTRESRDRFVQLLATRYGCDTAVAMFNARRGGPGFLFAPGLNPCEAAAFIPVLAIRAWRDSTGIREDWDTGYCVYAFRGVTERVLRAWTAACH